jgi:hypothetical protein
MGAQGKKKAEKLIRGILDISFPYCKRVMKEDTSREFTEINQKAYKLLKLIEHKEIE